MELFQHPDFIGASEIRRLEKLHLLRQCLGQNTLMIKVTLNKIGVILPHSYFSWNGLEWLVPAHSRQLCGMRVKAEITKLVGGWGFAQGLSKYHLLHQKYFILAWFGSCTISWIFLSICWKLPPPHAIVVHRGNEDCIPLFNSLFLFSFHVCFQLSSGLAFRQLNWRVPHAG